jgi:hypothetical protein
MSWDAVGGISAWPEFDSRGYAVLPRGRRRAVAVGVRASLALPAGARFPDAAAAALVRLARRVGGMVDQPAVRVPADEIAAALAAWRPPDRPAPEPAVLRERAQVVADSVDAGRALTLGDMERTQRAHLALCDLAAALKRNVGPPERAAEATNRELRALLA